MTNTATSPAPSSTKLKPTRARPASPARIARRTALAVVSAAIGLGMWLALWKAGLNGFPSPLAVLERAWDMARSGILFSDAWASLKRVLLGFALGSLLAIPCGFLLGWYPTVRTIFDPYLQFFRMVPPLAIIPLTIVLLGIGETPKIFIIFLAAFLSAVVATLQGVLSVEQTLVNAARVLGANDFTVFSRVVVPASSPFILVGMRIGLGASWATVVAAELIAAQAGLGYRMQQAQQFYDLPTIFVDLLAIGFIGLAMDRLLLLAERRLTRWQERRAG